MELQERLNQVTETIEKLQREKTELEHDLRVVRDEEREEQFRQFKKDVEETVEMIDGLRYKRETAEFIYGSEDGPRIYYRYDVDDKQSFDIVKQNIENNIRLHHLLKDFDYTFRNYGDISSECPNAYNKIYFSGERIYGSFELHGDKVQAKIVQYQCWDPSGFAIQLDDTTKIKACAMVDDIDIKIEDIRELQADEHFTENVQAMIEHVKSYVVKDHDE